MTICYRSSLPLAPSQVFLSAITTPWPLCYALYASASGLKSSPSASKHAALSCRPSLNIAHFSCAWPALSTSHARGSPSIYGSGRVRTGSVTTCRSALPLAIAVCARSASASYTTCDVLGRSVTTSAEARRDLGECNSRRSASGEGNRFDLGVDPPVPTDPPPWCPAA